MSTSVPLVLLTDIVLLYILTSLDPTRVTKRLLEKEKLVIQYQVRRRGGFPSLIFRFLFLTVEFCPFVLQLVLMQRFCIRTTKRKILHDTPSKKFAIPFGHSFIRQKASFGMIHTRKYFGSFKVSGKPVQKLSI